MKHIVYFSARGATSGKALSENLMKAGRMDIAIHSFIQAVYLSDEFRKDVVFHFVLYGMPDPPKHIEITITKNTALSKKDVGGFIKKVLYKYKEGEKREILPGCFIEKKSFLKVIEELRENGNEIFVLDKEGEDIRKVKIPKDCVFILGDQRGLPKREFKRLKKSATLISIGPKTYFASQTVAVVNNELDRRGI
ncbi:MAG: tRNA (pseudouridine(54)-N(1))-methyltransferase TrmY [Nanoarchaeota archaeon]